jgi:hypothetical protein
MFLNFDESSRGRIDALDLIINSLRSHEKKLEEISYRLEKLTRSID